MVAFRQRINFYQSSFRKPVVVLPLRQMLLGLLAVLAIMLILSALDYSRTVQGRATLANMEASRSKMESSIEKLQKQVDSIILDERLQKEEQHLRTGLQSKRQFLISLKQQGDTHQIQFSGYLQALANMDNSSIWLTRIVMQSPGPQLSLFGITDKPKSIPEYVADLKQENSFQGFAFKVFNLERLNDNQRFLTFSVSTQHDE